MSRDRARVLYVTDLAYEARGRRYCDEDIALTARLRESFDLALCHPIDTARLMDTFDVVVVRNSGPVIHYQSEYDAFRRRALSVSAKVFTELSGRGDMAGKQYLLDLTDAGYPVIPTVERASELGRLPATDRYVVKPKFGADSVGLRFVSAAELSALTWGDLLVQPRIDFRYEVSFYFVDRDFQYALYAPDVERRWELQPYAATADDLAFAQRFVDWNAIDHGIQRVDACRTQAGELLLVELEDLNPYLSLDRVPSAVREDVIHAMTTSIATLAARP
jgi:hypothetical protein